MLPTAPRPSGRPADPPPPQPRIERRQLVKPGKNNMRTDSKTQRAIRLFSALETLGIDYSTGQRLRRIEMTLRRWAELECGDCDYWASWAIERDETTGVPYLVTHLRNGPSRRRRIADREAGALRRLGAIMAGHPTLWAYHQGDPRGCALYVGRLSDIPEGGSVARYYTRGVAICI